jgi:hypothetical protein
LGRIDLLLNADTFILLTVYLSSGFLTLPLGTVNEINEVKRAGTRDLKQNTIRAGSDDGTLGTEVDHQKFIDLNREALAPRLYFPPWPPLSGVAVFTVRNYYR